MSATGRINASRLIRTVTVLLAIVAAVCVYATYQPQIDAAQRRIDDDNRALRSDEVAFSEFVSLRAERALLARRYESLFSQNAQAVFVRELATTVRRNGVALVSTNVSQEDPNDAHAAAGIFTKTHLTLMLRGSYRRLLTAIAELSTGSEIVDVQMPNLARDGSAVVATVPIDIYEPRRSPAGGPSEDAR